MASTRALTHAPWSSSKVQCALRCPREFHYRYVDKIAEIDVMPDARIGKAVHAALEKALQGATPAEAMAEARAELPDDDERDRLAAAEPGILAFLDRIADFRRRHHVSRQLVEYALAVRDDFSATHFHAADAFYRGVFDVGYLYDDRNLAVVDHKSGHRRIDPTYGEQLEGYAVLATAHFRGVRRFWLGVHWVGHKTLDWAPAVSLDTVGERMVPRVLANIEAAALMVDDGPRAFPSDYCLRCSYRSICPVGQAVRLQPAEDDEDPGL